LVSQNAKGRESEANVSNKKTAKPTKQERKQIAFEKILIERMKEKNKPEKMSRSERILLWTLKNRREKINNEKHLKTRKH